MSEKQDMWTEMTLGQICQQQYEEIEKKNIQLWDFEEENSLLRQKNAQLQTIIDQRNARIDELERWCTYLQTCLDKEKQHNLLGRILRKIKQIIKQG